ncbi:MAG: hypothetical protein PHX83_14450 [Acidobacteriia bacterium]|nr:hypothetical protein [Terriglobia bacterium]
MATRKESTTTVVPFGSGSGPRPRIPSLVPDPKVPPKTDEAFDPNRQTGSLALMAFQLAAETARELYETGKVSQRKIARTRMVLAQFAASEITALCRKRKA